MSRCDCAIYTYSDPPQVIAATQESNAARALLAKVQGEAAVVENELARARAELEERGKQVCLGCFLTRRFFGDALWNRRYL